MLSESDAGSLSMSQWDNPVATANAGGSYPKPPDSVDETPEGNYEEREGDISLGEMGNPTLDAPAYEPSHEEITERKTEPEQEPEPVQESEPKAEVLESVEKLQKQNEELKSQFDELKKQNDTLMERLNKLESAEDADKQVLERLDKLEKALEELSQKNVPSAPAPAPEPDKDILDRLEKLEKALKELKETPKSAPSPAPAPAPKPAVSAEPEKPVASGENDLSLSDSAPAHVYTLEEVVKGKFPTGGDPLKLLDEHAFETLMNMTKSEFRKLSKVKQYHAKTRFWSSQKQK